MSVVSDDNEHELIMNVCCLSPEISKLECVITDSRLADYLEDRAVVAPPVH